MKLESYEIQIGDEWFPVKGIVNPKGWLEWRDKDGAGGLKRPGTFRKKIKRTVGDSVNKQKRTDLPEDP